MSEELVHIIDSKLGFDFIDGDEYRYRNTVTDAKGYRHLSEGEIKILTQNSNHADCWNNILVKDPFAPETIRKCEFYGLVRIARMENRNLRFHDYEMPIGITHSRIISTDIGENCSIADCTYISHYIIKDHCILHRIDEMQSTNHAKFGSGIVKDGEDESVRVTLSLMNENEGRAIYPFSSITCADAYLMASFREDPEFTKQLRHLTDRSEDPHRGYYGIIEDECVIKSCNTIKDVWFGKGTYVKGANKLKNLRIHSALDETTQIGEGVELVNGIIGQGCHIFYGCKGVRFVMGERSNLKYGARLINSFLGDNSTISCCEVLSSLIFPMHEQHHNNSFLIAALIKGQSNMAAGANIGSNHNSRGADGEFVGGRGFWPALSSTIKYNSKVASYTLITKGNYPYELNISLPFSLFSSDAHTGLRSIMPSYWWRYNLYALERNSYKCRMRDKRKHPEQIIETAYLAPDTAIELMEGITLLALWTGEAFLEKENKEGSEEEKLEAGYALLNGEANAFTTLTVYAKNMERSSDLIEVRHPQEAYRAYRDMLLYYAGMALSSGLGKDECIHSIQGEDTSTTWENFGGQLVPYYRVKTLIDQIGKGEIKYWDEVHRTYKAWHEEYPADKARNGMRAALFVLGKDKLTKEDWDLICTHVEKTRAFIEAEVFATKEKDAVNSFRQITYHSKEEMDLVLGKTEDNPFIKNAKEESEQILERMKSARF